VDIDWHARYEIHASAQSPGLLHIHVNGALVHTLTWWDYEAGPESTIVSWERFGPSVSGQERVRLTVTPEHMSGDWIVGIIPTN